MTFLELLDEYNIHHAAEANGSADRSHFRSGWVQLEHCPRCDTRTWRLGYNVSGNYATCWACGYVTLTEILKEGSGLPWGKCKELLSGLRVTGQETFKRKPKGKLAIPSGVGEMHPAHIRYLKKRGFDPEHCQNFWGMKGIGIAPRLGWRLWIPIHYRGEIMSWTTRAIVDDVSSRYINAGAEEESVEAKTLLFGEDHCTHTIVITEGPLDAVAIGPGAVALMGLQHTQEQVRRIAEYPKRIICFDNETKAQMRSKRLAKDIQFYPGETIHVRLTTGKDAASADKSEIKELRKMFLDV